MAKKADGIKESTDSNTTIEEEDTRGKLELSLELALPNLF